MLAEREVPNLKDRIHGLVTKLVAYPETALKFARQKHRPMDL